MVIHCTKCDHEWQATLSEPCYACGVESVGEGYTVMHAHDCVVMTCDWCGESGKVIDTRSDNLPPMSEVMRDLANMYQIRKWEGEDDGTNCS